jgi:hypothetical protein
MKDPSEPKEWTCPKCGFQSPRRPVECQRCGVIVEKLFRKELSAGVDHSQLTEKYGLSTDEFKEWQSRAGPYDKAKRSSRGHRHPHPDISAWIIPALIIGYLLLVVIVVGRYLSVPLKGSQLPQSEQSKAQESGVLKAGDPDPIAKLLRSDTNALRRADEIAAAEAKVASSRPPKSPRVTQRRPPVGDCESWHWIEAVEGDGKIIKLEDGSLWEVDDFDTVTTSVWLPASEIIVCNGKMVNVDDGESAEVTPVTPSLHGRVTMAPAAPRSYVIEASANDETFVINGEVFKAKTYCFGFEKGDRVMFLSGSAPGVCASATILNMRSGQTCDVWCE